MNTLNGVNNYLDMVQLATMRNTLYQVTQASPAEQPLDYSQLQQSNQQLRQNARETGVELYSQVLQKQMLETYANTSENTNSTNNTNDSSSSVYTFDAGNVNETLEMAQQRAFGVALYEHMSTSENTEFANTPTNTPVSVYV